MAAPARVCRVLQRIVVALILNVCRPVREPLVHPPQQRSRAGLGHCDEQQVRFGEIAEALFIPCDF